MITTSPVPIFPCLLSITKGLQLDLSVLDDIIMSTKLCLCTHLALLYNLYTVRSEITISHWIYCIMLYIMLINVQKFMLYAFKIAAITRTPSRENIRNTFGSWLRPGVHFQFLNRFSSTYVLERVSCYCISWKYSTKHFHSPNSAKLMKFSN